MRQIKHWIFALILLLPVLLSGCAGMKSNLVSADVVQGLPKVLAAAKVDRSTPVLFPPVVPKPATPALYASLDDSQQQWGKAYYINIDSTPTCKGIHVCNIGAVYAVPFGIVTKAHDRDGIMITLELWLKNNTIAYFTPGYALGDYHWPQIQWYYHGTLYTIVWKTGNRWQMLKMANSAITAGPR